MENASKALLIAGGILVAMMILGIAILLYSSFSKTTEQYTTRMDINEITTFNSNFNVYEGRSDITAQDIITLYNFVEEYKKKMPINVTINIVGANQINNNPIDFLKDNLYYSGDPSDPNDDEIITFTCDEVKYDSDKEYVNLITFTKN